MLGALTLALSRLLSARPYKPAEKPAPCVVELPPVRKNDPVQALEKLSQAVRELVTGAGPIPDRLLKAGLCILTVHPDELPNEDLQRTFIDVRDDLTYLPTDGEGRLVGTLRITNDEDASEVAGRIFDLYRALDELTRQENPLRASLPARRQCQSKRSARPGGLPGKPHRQRWRRDREL